MFLNFISFCNINLKSKIKTCKHSRKSEEKKQVYEAFGILADDTESELNYPPP